MEGPRAEERRIYNVGKLGWVWSYNIILGCPSIDLLTDISWYVIKPRSTEIYYTPLEQSNGARSYTYSDELCVYIYIYMRVCIYIYIWERRGWRVEWSPLRIDAC